MLNNFRLTMTVEAVFFLTQTSKIITISDRKVESNSNFRQPVFFKHKHNFASRTISRAPVNQPNNYKNVKITVLVTI